MKRALYLGRIMAAVLLLSAFLFPVVFAFFESPVLVAEASSEDIGDGSYENPWKVANDDNSYELTPGGARYWKENGYYYDANSGGPVTAYKDKRVDVVNGVVYPDAPDAEPLVSFEGIEEKIRQGLISCINFLNESLKPSTDNIVEAVADYAGKGVYTAETAPIFLLIKTLHETLVLPIAGVIVACMLTWDLMQLVIEGNNAMEHNPFAILKWIVRMAICVLLIMYSWTIILYIYSIGVEVANKAKELMTTGNTLEVRPETLSSLNIGQLVAVLVVTAVVGLAATILRILIFGVAIGRLFEMLIYLSVAAIPIATLVNKEWSNVGFGYIGGAVALGFQGFFMIIIAGMFSVLTSGTMSKITGANASATSIIQFFVFSIVLFKMLLQSGQISKGIFGGR